MMTGDPLCFLDIETGPQPEEALRGIMPEFAAPANFKDPEKIAANIAHQRAEWLGDAALSALTGQVLAIGFLWTDHEAEILEGPEHIILPAAFQHIRDCIMGARYHLCGFNICAFDLPFLIRRAWANQVKPPALLAGRYFPPWIVDLRLIWGFYDRQARGRLGEIGQFLGLGGQVGSGADFARLYADPATRPEALAHLRRDLDLTRSVAARLL